MARRILSTHTLRYRIPYANIPTMHGYDHPPQEEYGTILDCVYEMADMVSTSNGISVDSAIEQVLKDEGWHILPTHKQLILSLLLGDR